jgi:signal transduction histidine kinase
MRERLRLAGGDVRITSAPGEGTELEFAIPIAEG